MATFSVKAHWDPEALVWWAESDDVPGLVAESETHDALVTELKALIPELLAANVPEHVGHHQIVIVSDQTEDVFAE